MSQSIRRGRKLRLIGAAVVALLAIASFPQVSQSGSSQIWTKNPNKPEKDPTIATTATGEVQGTLNGTVLKFLGIPYAKPPVGPLRWANPVPATRWSGVRRATEFGKFCAQNKRLGDFAAGSTDEDCLYLNVFAPKGGEKRPVMVWIHGGGLFVGHSNGYDGSALVQQQDVVVVTLNYRLNAFGFLVHPALDGGGKTTNYGLRDQQLALQWVKQNIKNFGGDPNNITIFGESAGGLSVMLQMVSPKAKGLFHKAIIQSGAYSYWSSLNSLAAGEARGQSFATAIGCPDQSAACLRNAPVSAILAAEAASGSTVVNDGEVLRMSIHQAITSGQFNRVPVFNGSNHDEYRWFQAFSQIATNHVIAPSEYPGQLTAAFGANAPAVELAYPLAEFNSPDEALATARGDNTFICPTRNFSLDASRQVKVYGYEFNDRKSPGILPPVSFPLLAAHTHRNSVRVARVEGGLQWNSHTAYAASAGSVEGNDCELGNVRKDRCSITGMAPLYRQERADHLAGNPASTPDQQLQLRPQLRFVGFPQESRRVKACGQAANRRCLGGADFSGKWLAALALEIAVPPNSPRASSVRSAGDERLRNFPHFVS